MCSNDTSILATDVFFSNALHVLTCFELPVHLFGALIVLTKTPKRMASVKRNMIILHCAGATCDVYLSVFAFPVFTLPACAGYTLGLGVWLRVPTPVQAYCGFSLAGVVAVAIVAFLEDRYHVLGNGVSLSTRRSWARRAHLAVNYIVAFLYIVPTYFSIPEQVEAKQELLRKIPCFPAHLLDRPGFFVVALDATTFVLCFTAVGVFLFVQSTFFTVFIIYRLAYSQAKSRNSLRIQKQFLVALGIQVAIPVTVLFVPAGYIVAAVTSGYYNQAFTNVCTMMVAFHGLASTVTMLIVHRPYREATLETLRLVKLGEYRFGGSRVWNTSGNGASHNHI